jgi:LuxR family transcriptional regulator, maltose regulon positive regulatory protein
MSHLSLLLTGQGQLRAAADTASAAVDLARRHGLATQHQTAGALLSLALVSLEWNDLGAARRHLVAATQACDAGPWRPLMIGATLVRAWLCIAEKQPHQGVAILEANRERLVAPQGASWLGRWVDATDAQLRIALGDLDTARILLDGLPDGDGGPWSAPLGIAMADLQLASGDPVAALDAVMPYVDGRAETLTGPLISAQLVAGVAANAEGDRQLERRVVEHALTLAEAEGFRQRFTPPAVRPLLGAHLERVTAHRPFIARLMDDAGPTPRRSSAPLTVAEPLSQRERVVLRYLPSRLSAAEIADDLFVSVHTVKTHMRHIYRKVHATSRREAVDRARAIGLL